MRLKERSLRVFAFFQPMFICGRLEHSVVKLGNRILI